MSVHRDLWEATAGLKTIPDWGHSQKMDLCRPLHTGWSSCLPAANCAGDRERQRLAQAVCSWGLQQFPALRVRWPRRREPEAKTENRGEGQQLLQTLSRKPQ